MATRIELHDPELPGFIKTVIDTVEDSIKGDKKGPTRKVAAVAELERSINLPRFLPAPLKKMLLGLMVETVFRLVKEGAEALIDAVRGDAEKKAKQIIDAAEKTASKPAPKKRRKKKGETDDADGGSDGE